MNYYDNPKNVTDYIQMAKGCNGKNIINALTQHLGANASILELGSGPGNDLEILISLGHSVQGSDISKPFVNHLKQRFEQNKIHQLDAIHFELPNPQKFDCIYSNKVLHHLTLTEFEKSLLNQTELLKPNGVVCHSFWLGDDDIEKDGFFAKYYRENELGQIFEMNYEIVDSQVYTEEEKNDSIFIIGKVLD